MSIANNGGITFAACKADLATVTDNGSCSDDARVLLRLNEATKMLLDELIPVGGMATFDVVATGTVLLLPRQLEAAYEVEVRSAATVRAQTDVTQGWYDLVNNFTYVDPAMQHDNPLVDLGLVPDDDDPTILRRQYDYPGLQNNATVRVTGPKRYQPITADNQYLIIQNVPALKLAILSIERLERNQPESAAAYFKMAVDRLQAEVKKHQLDPRNSLKRKAAYQADIVTYDEGTLGRTRARLALELPGFLLRGKAEISYFVNRAVQMLVDNRNQLAITGRISVHGGVTELAYTPATTPDTVLAWPDYNDIRLMVQSFVTETGDPQTLPVAEEYQKKAFESQRAKLIEATEKLRHTTYTTALATYKEGMFGWAVARLALEMPGGLALTTAEIERTANMAEMRLIDRGIWKGCLKTISATISGGDIYFPRDVEAVLAADICGMPTDVRSIFFQFQQNGPGGFQFSCPCNPMFTDLGDVYFKDSGTNRRKYHFHGSCSDNYCMTAVCKFRHLTKSGNDELVIKNFEALRLASQAVQLEKAEKWQEANAAMQFAVDILEKETREWVSGIQHVVHVSMGGFGMGDIGSPL